MNDNIQEKSVIARCSVKNYMQTYQLEPHKVKITKYIKKSVRFAREHYHAQLEKKGYNIIKDRQEREYEDVKKRELQNLQNKREEAKLNLFG